MSASSDKRLELFAKLETKQIQCLLNILFQATMHGKHFVETAYGERARNFVETLQFLKDIQWVEEQQGELALSYAGSAAHVAAQNEEEIRTRITEALIAEVSRCSEVVVKTALLLIRQERRTEKSILELLIRTNVVFQSVV